MQYATVDDVAAGFRTLNGDEISKAVQLLNEAAVIIDSYQRDAPLDALRVVSVNMVRRALSAPVSAPLGASEGSFSAGSFSHDWKTADSAGELYLTALDKKLLRTGRSVGVASPYDC